MGKRQAAVEEEYFRRQVKTLVVLELIRFYVCKRLPLSMMQRIKTRTQI